MTLLAVHTSDAQASIAVAVDARIEAVEFVAAGTHAPGIWVHLQRALRQAGVTLADCDAMAVTVGPGSFTGIRIGIATVQGIAAARGLPVWTCGSLAAHAAAAAGTGTGRSVLREPLAVVLDARRGEVFAALYDVSATAPQPLVVPFCAAPLEAAARLAAGGAGVVCGSGAELVELPSARRLGAAAEPVATALARLVAQGACRKSAARDLEPEYLRKSDAELQRHGPSHA